MNDWTLALIVIAAWALASLPFGLFAARALWGAHRERTIDRAVADPGFWEHAEAEMRKRRQP